MPALRQPIRFAVALAAFVWQGTLVVPLSGQEVRTGPWKRNGLATERFTISGTGGRNNPLRKQLDPPFAGDELFVRFSLRYAADSIDTPPDGSGEFFVLWLDREEGVEGSPHANQVPNLGIHVQDDRNHFMVRYNASGQKFGPRLEGDRDYLVLGRLWKSQSGPDRPYDQLDLWVDPQPEDEFSPDVSTHHPQSISEVHWIGFSTGAKTEIDDRIEVWEIRVADSWHKILDLPSDPTSARSGYGKAPTSLKKTVSFREHIYPLLEKHCFECHSGSDSEQGIRLDVVDEVLNQVTLFQSKQSHLYQLVADAKMPPSGPVLGEEEVRLLATWIDEGLDWDESLLPIPVPETEHWAFRPIERPEVPQVKNPSWVRTPVDAFIAAKQDALGLEPNAAVDVSTLNRRRSLDLHGLPPEPERMREPISVDQLLADPAYGQRWGRHWLDVARWAESNGHQHNRDRAHAWRYRDWVVDAFHQGMRFDDFLRRQIAGDEIVPYAVDNLIATGFLAAARYSGNELDKQIQRNDILADVANTTAAAFLGLTMECAQCHSHKFDPLTIRDYYRFQAFFVSGQPQNVVLTEDSRVKDRVRRRWQIFDQVHQRIVNVRRKQGYPEPIDVTPDTVVAQMHPGEKKEFQQLDKEIAGFDQTWSYYSPSTASTELAVAPHDMRWPLPRNPAWLAKLEAAILIRGEVHSPGPTVQPGWPLVFGNHPAAPTRSSEERLSRLDLAQWLTSPANPLTARVWVNRLWQWHFGRGLVETSSDFGTQGAKPSHPQLLDFLASELIDSDWDTNHIQKLILESSTYRLSNQYSPSNAEIDPDNRWYWRWSPRRLEAEAIRDSLLFVSGQLDLDRGGPSQDSDSRRRSIYLKQKRDNLPAQQILFDSANGIASCSRRRVSTNSLQPLWLMNSELAQQAAAGFAQRAGSVEDAIRIALHREGDEQEIQQLKRLADEFGLESACMAILNSSEFLYIP